MQNEKTKRPSFGAAEFKVICKPDRVQLIIHGSHIVAETKEDVYNEAFSYIVQLLGGRKDKAWVKNLHEGNGDD